MKRADHACHCLGAGDSASQSANFLRALKRFVLVKSERPRK